MTTTIEELHECLPRLGPGSRAFVAASHLDELLALAAATPPEERRLTLERAVREMVAGGHIVIVQDEAP